MHGHAVRDNTTDYSTSIQTLRLPQVSLKAYSNSNPTTNITFGVFGKDHKHRSFRAGPIRLIAISIVADSLRNGERLDKKRGRLTPAFMLAFVKHYQELHKLCFKAFLSLV